VREPLSEDEIKRIARATARETVKHMFDLLFIVALSVVGIGLLPMLMIMTVNSFAPPFGHTGSPLLGLLFALTFAVVAAILIRSWVSIRR
jgi:hypothetical protein